MPYCLIIRGMVKGGQAQSAIENAQRKRADKTSIF
jgi:hypothetical protein